MTFPNLAKRAEVDFAPFGFGAYFLGKAFNELYDLATQACRLLVILMLGKLMA